MADTSIAGKVAIVSGAGGGLGRAMTLALVEAGARIAAVDANRELAERIAGDAGDVAGEDCVVAICRDLRDPDSCAATGAGLELTRRRGRACRIAARAEIDAAGRGRSR